MWGSGVGLGVELGGQVDVKGEVKTFVKLQKKKFVGEGGRRRVRGSGWM